jgi:hypothetical protein
MGHHIWQIISTRMYLRDSTRRQADDIVNTSQGKRHETEFPTKLLAPELYLGGKSIRRSFGSLRRIDGTTPGQ